MNVMEAKYVIKGVSVCVPSRKINSEDIEFENEVEKKIFLDKLGIQSKRVSNGILTTCDLSYHATIKLIEELNWKYEDIDLLFSVTQSPDFSSPGNAYILHKKLGLKQSCLLIDLNAGCTGWIQALIQTISMADNLGLKKVLIVCGDTNMLADKFVQKSDRLMGDMGTATAIQLVSAPHTYYWSVYNFGEEFQAIYTPESGADKYRLSPDSGFSPIMKMDTEKVHQFITSQVFNKIHDFRNSLPYQPDKTLLHQPNKIHTNYLLKKLKMTNDNVPDVLGEYGNVSSACIPYSLFKINSEKSDSPRKISCHAFGVGLSIANIAFELDKIITPHLVEIDD